MTNKSNIEIIMYGLEDYFEKRSKPIMLDEAKRLNEQFASILLSKLNKLDRKKLEDNFWKFYSSALYEKEQHDIGNLSTDGLNIGLQHSVNYFIDQVLTLIPEEGIVIAEGKVFKGDNNIYIGQYFGYYSTTIGIIEKKLEKYIDKKGKLIFIEDKE